MRWDDIKPRRFPAFERNLDGVSRQTMEDHYKLYEGYINKTNECRKLLNEFKYSEIGRQPGVLGPPGRLGRLHVRAARL